MCFASRSRWRSLLPLPPEATANATRDHDATHVCPRPADDGQVPPGAQTALDVEAGPDAPDAADLLASPEPSLPPAFADMAPTILPLRLPWAALLRRTLGVDGDRCPKCQSQTVLLALITAKATVTKILDHLKIPSSPPPIAPARDPHEQCELLQDDIGRNDASDAVDDASQLRQRTACSRGPP